MGQLSSANASKAALEALYLVPVKVMESFARALKGWRKAVPGIRPMTSGSTA